MSADTLVQLASQGGVKARQRAYDGTNIMIAYLRSRYWELLPRKISLEWAVLVGIVQDSASPRETGNKETAGS